MNAITEWILHQISTQWIAIVTAIAGFVVWKRAHSKMIVQKENEPRPIANLVLDDGGIIVNREVSLQQMSIWLINQSDEDISFYDLRMLSDTGDINFFTEVQFNKINGLSGRSAIGITPFVDGKPSNESVSIEIPTKGYGTVPSHGFVQIDLIFHAENTYDNGMVVMKLALPHTLFGRFRHSRWAPKFCRPKTGYLWSETQEVSLSFQVKDIQKFELSK